MNCEKHEFCTLKLNSDMKYGLKEKPVIAM